jgi:hypothetical protein
MCAYAGVVIHHLQAAAQAAVAAIRKGVALKAKKLKQQRAKSPLKSTRNRQC